MKNRGFNNRNVFFFKGQTTGLGFLGVFFLFHSILNDSLIGILISISLSIFYIFDSDVQKLMVCSPLYKKNLMVCLSIGLGMVLGANYYEPYSSIFFFINVLIMIFHVKTIVKELT